MGCGHSSLYISPFALWVTEVTAKLTDEEVANLTMAFEIDKRKISLKPLKMSKQEQMLLLLKRGLSFDSVQDVNDVLGRIGRSDLRFGIRHDEDVGGSVVSLNMLPQKTSCCNISNSIVGGNGFRNVRVCGSAIGPDFEELL